MKILKGSIASYYISLGYIVTPQRQQAVYFHSQNFSFSSSRIPIFLRFLQSFLHGFAFFFFLQTILTNELQRGSWRHQNQEYKPRSSGKWIHSAPDCGVLLAFSVIIISWANQTAKQHLRAFEKIRDKLYISSLFLLYVRAGRGSFSWRMSRSCLWSFFLVFKIELDSSFLFYLYLFFFVIIIIVFLYYESTHNDNSRLRGFGTRTHFHNDLCVWIYIYTRAHRSTCIHTKPS